MERLLGAARPLSLASLETSVSSCSTLSSEPLLLCHEMVASGDSNLTGLLLNGRRKKEIVCYALPRKLVSSRPGRSLQNTLSSCNVELVQEFHGEVITTCPQHVMNIIMVEHSTE